MRNIFLHTILMKHVNIYPAFVILILKIVFREILFPLFSFPQLMLWKIFTIILFPVIFNLRLKQF